MEAKMPHNRLSHTRSALYSLSNNLDPCLLSQLDSASSWIPEWKTDGNWVY
jgi:hypothetical protein